MKYVAPSAPLGIGGVLDNWIRLFRTSFAVCWPLALIAGLVGAAMEFTMTPAALPSPSVQPLQYYLQYWSAIRAPTVLLTDFVLFFVGLLVYGALLEQQTAIARGEDPFSFGDALAKGLGRLPQMLLGVLLIILIVVAFCIPAGIGVAVLIPLRNMPVAVLFGSLAAVALLILLLYVSVRLQIWMAVMFSENLGGASSLGRSWELAKGHWWRVTGIGFVSGIVIWILGMAIGGVIALVVGFVGFHGTPELLIRRMQIIGALGGITRLLTMPLLTAVWLAIYQDLKLRREGGDLAARAEALGGT